MNNSWFLWVVVYFSLRSFEKHVSLYFIANIGRMFFSNYSLECITIRSQRSWPIIYPTFFARHLGHPSSTRYEIDYYWYLPYFRCSYRGSLSILLLSQGPLLLSLANGVLNVLLLYRWGRLFHFSFGIPHITTNKRFIFILFISSNSWVFNCEVGYRSSTPHVNSIEVLTYSALYLQGFVAS